MRTVYQKGVEVLFLISVVVCALWSWVLVDPNFTLIPHADWTRFKELAISIGYLNRPLSTQWYIGSITALTLTSLYLVIRPPKYLMGITLFVAFVAGLLSYPALSHDLFNYIFDARIFTHYGQNPYLHAALDFPADPMLRFMHWVHRPYPYGPTYLLFSFIPSFLGLNYFSVTFALFKAANAALYVLCVWLLMKYGNTKTAALFALNPLVIIEGLINTHNDFVAAAFTLCGLVVLSQGKRWSATALLIFSGLMKYFTLPYAITLLMPMLKKHKRSARYAHYMAHIALIIVTALIVYVSLRQGIQQWYLINLIPIVWYFPRIILWSYVLVWGFLMSYLPYVSGGQWNSGSAAEKDVIVLNALIANGVIVLLYYGTRLLYEAVQKRRSMN